MIYYYIKKTAYSAAFHSTFKTTYMLNILLKISKPAPLEHGHLATPLLSVICSQMSSPFHVHLTVSFAYLPMSLNVLTDFSLFGQALDRLVTVSYTHCCASTSALSTSSSSRGLTSFEWDISS